MSDPQLFPHGEPPAAAQPATLREATAALVAKLDAILPIVDGMIGLNYARTHQQYTGPNLIVELAEVKRLLAVAPAAALSPSLKADFNDGAFGEAAYCHHRHHLNTDDEIATGIVEGEFVGFGKVHTSDFDTCRHSICVAARKSAALSPSEEPKK